MLDKAYEIANRYHKGQTDKAGKDYMIHLETVATSFEDEDLKIVALLHDVVEDTECTYEDLEILGFGSEVIDAIKAITKIKGERYEDYLNRVFNNELARRVKLIDLSHNADLTRLKDISAIDMDRHIKYKKAIEYLAK